MTTEITLFPYQEDAVETIVKDVVSDQFLLLQAPTGAGKTVMFSALIKRFMHQYKMRILVLAHREILISQTAEKLKAVWPDVPLGLACASAGEVDLNAPVVVGSVQTIANRLNVCPPFHLVIVDEAHRSQPRNVESQYNKLFGQMLSYYPQMRILGVTATPYRLGHGYIYGENCKAGAENWFPRLNFQISMKALQEYGRLVQFRGYEAENIEQELSQISKVGGEYNEKQLSMMMTKQIHLDSAVRVYRELGENRQHCVVFTVDIKHAEAMKETIAEAGYSVGIIHSEMTKEERKANLAAFENGSIQFIVNVGVLTEGWDCPHADLILYCRPTMSPALHVQMLGRGLRVSPGKEDCILLDLSGNWRKHGHPDHPNVVIPGKKRESVEKSEAALERTCPKCESIIHSRTWVCPECGFWLVEVAKAPEMKAIDTKAKKKHTFETRTVPSVVAKVLNFSVENYCSRAGNLMLRMSLMCLPEGATLPLKVNHYLDFEGASCHHARVWWTETLYLRPPQNNQAALEYLESSFQPPAAVRIAHDGNFWKVTKWNINDFCQ